MENEIFQYSFFVGGDNQLFMDEKSSILESNIPDIYKKYHRKFRLKNNLSPDDISYLSHFMHFTFTKETNYQEICYCSKSTQTKALNLFHEYYYYLIHNGINWNEKDYILIQDVILFEEKILPSTPNFSELNIDIGKKGLVKSELYKAHNYKTYHSES